jgi:predicted kinase
VLEARLAERAAAGNDPSEATTAVLAHQLQTEDPLAAHELTHTISLRTDVAASFTFGLEAICARLERAAPCRTAIGA